jgi:hypothetical protein
LKGDLWAHHFWPSTTTTATTTTTTTWNLQPPRGLQPPVKPASYTTTLVASTSTRDSQPATIANWRFGHRTSPYFPSGYITTKAAFACDLHTATTTTTTAITVTTTSCNPIS